MQITRRTSILYATLQTDLALMGGIYDNSLSVGDIYVHDKETRPLYVKFTMSFLMSWVFLGLKNSFSHKINSSGSLLSFWGLRRTVSQLPVAVDGQRGCGVGWGSEGHDAAILGHTAAKRAVCSGCCSWAECDKGRGRENVALTCFFWKCVWELEGAFTSVFSDKGTAKSCEAEKK